MINKKRFCKICSRILSIYNDSSSCYFHNINIDADKEKGESLKHNSIYLMSIMDRYFLIVNYDYHGRFNFDNFWSEVL